MAVEKKALKPKRLTPKPDVLRELYLLSGNNCAMPQCNHVIIDHAGVVVGHVCHIEAAMPDGPRFNPHQTNEQRRAFSNLVLMCAMHHAQIDSMQHEATYTVQKLRKIKADHEKKFKGLAHSLEQAFESSYVDLTDSLAPTNPESFAQLEQVVPHCKVDESDQSARLKQVRSFVKKLSKVPADEREFMTSVIKRWIKLEAHTACVQVHVEDIKGAMGISHRRIKMLGEAMERYEVGSIGLAGSFSSDKDEWHVIVDDPSDFVTWADIARLCKKTGREIDDFSVRLDFGLLDAT
ncbi:hypothetical protein VAR608DRAFT_4908 [Variovorax sp. HW608]|uniref:hypothetical protein n=1 Tax=Variovorax sp. HW608 TaxID=1034889 RepID=UPI00081FFB28|nr:hypothetical protein [Variovorax sp. HW608]SCK49303.1 hypothetical protein VAR608DRAFT_4908 [Variovorax sp. HW608]